MRFERENDRLFDQLLFEFSIAQREVKQLKSYLLRQKYSPDQPRVPAGESDAGQWTSGEGTEDNRANEGWRSAMASKRSEAFCNRQYERDVFQCKMVGSAGCYRQAMERYAACLNGRQIPPFNY